MTGHPTESLGAYADGELPPARAAEVERHLESCTECARELALIRTLGGAMRAVSTPPPPTLWEGIHRRITRPLGWVLLVGGATLWGILALGAWFRESLTLSWVAATAVGVGVAMLGIGIAHEQYREWKDSPYRDIER